MIRGDGDGLAPVRLARGQVVPPAIACGDPRDVVPHPLEHEDVLDRRTGCDRFISRLLHPHDLTAPLERVRGDQDLRFGVLQP